MAISLIFMFKAALDNPAMSNALKATGLDTGSSSTVKVEDLIKYEHNVKAP